MPGASLIQRQLLGDGCEEFGDILGCLGGSFEEQETGLARIGLGISSGNGALVRLLGNQVELVASECDDDIFVGLTLELLDPSLCLV